MMNLNDIPKELKWVILTFLELKYMPQFFSIDKSWNISNNEMFWKEIGKRDKFFSQEIKNKTIVIKDNNYKEEYKRFRSYCVFVDVNNDDKNDTIKYDFLFKYLFIGDSSVGKSSFLRRYTEGIFNDSYVTIGVDFKNKNIKNLYSNEHCKIQIWDTAGEERFRTISNAYFRNAHSILLLFDLSVRCTFNSSIDRYMNEITENAPKNCTVVLIGTKCDLKKKREVTREEAEKKAEKYGIKYFETSSKDDINVTKTFNYLSLQTLKKFKNGLFYNLYNVKPKTEEDTNVSKYPSCIIL